MSQVFIFGASSVYGAGGSDGGWADMIKRQLHDEMFGPGGGGEKHQVYNFAKPGATIKFVLDTYIDQIKKYRDPGKVVAIVSIGLNNTKAHNSPDNFLSDLDEYQHNMHQLLGGIKTKVDKVICVGYAPVDESKMPLVNDLYGKSYFFNKRIQEFNLEFKKICDELEIDFINIDITEEEWVREYLYDDGLHPNDKGHKFVYTKVIPVLKKYL